MAISLSSIKNAIRRHPRRTIAVLGLILILVAGGVFWYIRSHSKDNAAEQTVTYSTDQPDERKPDNNYKWVGGPEDPKKINIPSANIEGYIQKVGVDQKKQVAVPNNIHIAGWFTESVRPGQLGLSIIDGHVTGPTADGIFKNLLGVKPGATYTIEFGNGSTKTFEVLTVKEVPVNQAASVVFSQEPKQSHQVNLVTCSGPFNRAANQYENRVIVTSKLVE